MAKLVMVSWSSSLMGVGGDMGEPVVEGVDVGGDIGKGGVGSGGEDGWNLVLVLDEVVVTLESSGGNGGGGGKFKCGERR